MRASTTSRFVEVRRITATALRVVWSSNCVRRRITRRCIHSIALGCVEAGLRDCRLGPSNGEGRRNAWPIPGRIIRALDTIEPQDLVLSRLTAPIIATGEAAQSACCVRDTALNLANSILVAHARGAAFLGNEVYIRNEDDHHYFAARALFSLGSKGNVTPLVTCLAIYAGCYVPLGYVLQDMSRLATYDATLRASLASVWPVVMHAALDAMESEEGMEDGQYRREYTLAYMLPHPIPSTVDAEPATSLCNAGVDWLDPSVLEELVERWIPLARGIPGCVDAGYRSRTDCLASLAGERWTALD